MYWLEWRCHRKLAGALNNEKRKAISAVLLDTSGHDLIFFVTTELGPDSQLEK